MDLHVFETLFHKALIDENEFEAVKQQKKNATISVRWELKTLLYLGILLISSGLGILIYKNIGSIGHAIIISLIAITCATCFVYCFKQSRGYSDYKTDSPNIWFDYVLLLGCLLLISLVAYLQFQYHVFGNKYGLATFIPMVILFATAYYFDHLGVLSMAVTNLAAWAGVAVTPSKLISENDFNSNHIIFTGLILGVFLLFVSLVVKYKQIKSHFSFTYKNFGTHILFVSALAALFHFNKVYILWFVFLAGISAYFFINSIKEKSFYFIVIVSLYAYVGLSYVVIRLLWTIEDVGSIYIGFTYFILSAIFFIKTLMHYNKQFKKNDSI